MKTIKMIALERALLAPQLVPTGNILLSSFIQCLLWYKMQLFMLGGFGCCQPGYHNNEAHPSSRATAEACFTTNLSTVHAGFVGVQKIS